MHSFWPTATGAIAVLNMKRDDWRSASHIILQVQHLHLRNAKDPSRRAQRTEHLLVMSPFMVKALPHGCSMTTYFQTATQSSVLGHASQLQRHFCK